MLEGDSIVGIAHDCFSVVSGYADIVVIFWLILLHEDFVTRPIDWILILLSQVFMG